MEKKWWKEAIVYQIYPRSFKDNNGNGSPYFLNDPCIHEYLQEMNKKVLSKYDIMTVGETPGTTPQIAAKYVNRDRYELDMVFHFELMEID